MTGGSGKMETSALSIMIATLHSAVFHIILLLTQDKEKAHMPWLTYILNVRWAILHATYPLK